MAFLASIGLLILGLVALLGFAAFGAVSLGEREPRAATISFALALAVPALLGAAALSPVPVRTAGAAALTVAALAAALLVLAPVGRGVRGHGRPTRRVDEREIMFARRRLRPGSPEYEAYYRMKPEHKAGDDRTRALPGLLSPSAKKAEPVAFASAEASFALTEALRDEVDGPVAPVRRSLSPGEASAMVKRLALYHGAREVGITELRPYHVYSHVGRGTGTYGQPIDLNHRWAAAFTVEMDHAAIRHAPEAPVVAESARQYVEAAKIAIQIGSVIRSMGFPARAHIDGNYRVIAPLVARDAGLGEIGRMGILMTPRLGPRVRLGVVTTDLPLSPDAPGDDLSMIDFCLKCKKCALNCPSGSIPLGDRVPIDDGVRWVIDSDTCFRYWNVIGTDCARCVAVCPYSHPDGTAHNLVRWAARRSGSARRAALWMDDLFYGRRPRGRGAGSADSAARSTNGVGRPVDPADRGSR